METHKHLTFQQIDKFFEEFIQKAKARCTQLKAEFESVEANEKLRLEKARAKIEEDLHQIRGFSQGFLNFYYNFEESADFNSNKATYSKFLRDLERIKESSQKKPYYFKLAKHEPSQFKFIETDLKLVEKMGKIVNGQAPE